MIVTTSTRLGSRGNPFADDATAADGAAEANSTPLGARAVSSQTRPARPAA